MKLKDQLPKFMHKKELEMQDMQVEKPQYLLVAVLHMDLKEEVIIKLEN